MNPLLIKISGELFSNESSINTIIAQIKALTNKQKVGIVIGGGNFFRGASDKSKLGLTASSADMIGMLSTMVNGIMLNDLLAQQGVSCKLLSALVYPSVADVANHKEITHALEQHDCIIFVGGTGNPFFTTDTNAVLRALQIGADQVWKATKVDGVYDNDPLINKSAKRYSVITYQEALDKNLKIMDKTAITLAQEHSVQIRVFDLFADNALLQASKDPKFGSKIH